VLLFNATYNVDDAIVEVNKAVTADDASVGADDVVFEWFREGVWRMKSATTVKRSLLPSFPQ
jgi:hypothetical protein